MTKKLAAWRLLALAALALLGTGFMSSSASAQTATSNFLVQANVPDICTITNTGPMNFGTYDPLAAAPNNTGQTDISIVCTPGTTYDVGLNDGANGIRNMIAGGGGLLAYDIYTDAGRTLRWDAVGGANTNSLGAPGYIPAGGPDVYTAYGQIAVGEPVTETGAYLDTIIATVSF